MPVPISKWEAETTGLFEAWFDRRDLAVLYHPWNVSQAGLSATITRKITIPEGWGDGVRIHFYMSDDYDASQDAATEGWVGQINLIGHRFKQFLVNGTVVWERDVADAVKADAEQRFSVVLPESVRAGDTVRIAFRLLDRVGSGERLPEDHRHIGSTDNITEGDPWKFWTHVYIGDVSLTPRSIESIPPAAMPALALIAGRPATRKSSAPIEFPFRLQVRHAPNGDVPFPIICGIPFPPSAVRSPDQVRLRSVAGEPIPCSANTMNTWPDGNVRWARMIAVLPAHTTEILLDVGTGPVTLSVPGPLLGTSLSSGTDGRMSASLGHANRAHSTIAAPLRIHGEEVFPYVEKIETISADDPHHDIEVHGKLRSQATEYGRFVFRVLALSGIPVARIDYRIFNDRAETLHVSRQSINLEYPSELRRVSGDSAAGWISALGETGSVVAVIRHFVQQQPKSISLEADELRLFLIDSPGEEPAYRPHEGEAKRHEVWIGLWDEKLSPETLAAHAAWMATPPGLFNADYFCRTGALGMAFPHDATRFAELTAFMDKTYGPMGDQDFYQRGIRNWGDNHFNAEENTWRNGYYDVQQGFASEYLMTGKVEWFDRLEASVRHIIDIDICHASAEHPDWVGSIHAYYGSDHSTAAPWNPTQRTKGTLAYWRLTGDRDAREAALGVADSALAAKRAIGAVSSRDHAGILVCLTAAYDETREPKYLEAAKRVAHDAMRRINPRRGTYGEVHGNLSYRGNVPWMVAQLAEPMYDYYRQSGDRAAAVAIVSMAESILAENRTRGVPGDLFGYSHNPHFTRVSNYHILIAPAILYAYELTGDTEFLKQARALYVQTIQERTVNSIMNCYWNTPTLLYYLNAYGDVEVD